MNFDISSPAYYSREFFIDDEVWYMCYDIHKYFQNKEYSECVSDIKIRPIVAPKSVLDRGLFQKGKHCSVIYGFADASLQIDFMEYHYASIEKRKTLIIRNVLKSMKALKNRAKINYATFEKDLILFCKERGIKY